MIKRAKRELVFSAYLQIFLIIGTSFAFAFLMSDNFVSGAEGDSLFTSEETSLSLGSSSSGSSVSTTSFSDYATQNPVSLGSASASPVQSISTVSTPTQTSSTLFTAQDTSLGLGGSSTTSTAGESLFTPNDLTVNPYGASGGAAITQGSIVSKASYKVPFLGTQLTGAYAHLAQGLVWSIGVVSVIQLIGGIAGLDSATTTALSIAAFGGIMAGKGLAAIGPSGNGFISQGSFFARSGVQFGVGLIVAAVIFIALYKDVSKKMVTFQCLPFEPPLGGAKCEECNKDPFRLCSEYRCKSLGQACQLLNAGTKEEQCAWVSRNDVKSPTISPWNSALEPDGLKYVPDTAIRPPAIGTKIVSSGSCLPAFTPLQFGIATDEPAQCKLDYNHTSKFDDMQYFFGDSNYYQYNHTQKMRLPGPSSANNTGPGLVNDGNFALYTRCRDANGNENVDEYVFSFCVDKGPDTTPPVIEEFSIPSGSYVAHNQFNVPIEVYVNEPSECKWSVESKSYEDMENPMQCFTESYQVNANLQYTCAGNLTGVENNAENKYYFRCKDQPAKAENERNVNVQSKELIIKGSQPLNIINIAPNGTVSGSTNTVNVNLEVETDDGAESGKAVCYFSPTGAKDTFITMFETNNFVHKQLLTLISGDYKYYFRCVDSGGNVAEANTGFNVKVDNQAPRITRVYKQDALKVVTDEDAECTYSLQNCNFNFDDGIKMIYSNVDIKNNLFAEWKASSTYYIKCRDKYGNEPEPNKCSITAGAIELKGNV